MKVVLVGAGNTGTVLGRMTKEAGHEIIQVVSRTPESAKSLADQLNCGYSLLDADTFSEADLYIVCLSDYAMKNLENLKALQGKFVVHTAGSLSINVLEQCSDRYGVLYPLQTLSKYVDHLPEIPFMVDGNNSETLDIIFQFAKTLSPNVTQANDQKRLSYHIAAVFAANYSNHMYSLAELYCQRENIEFKNLLPLITENCKKVNQYSPFLTQTGPAIRNDVFTITKHLEALSDFNDLKYVYLKLTESIMKVHGKR